MRKALQVPLIVLIFVLASYEAFLRLTGLTADQGENYTGDNFIVLENYADGTYQADTVLVGTSYTRMMPDGALPPGWKNLGLDGDSMMSALQIVAARKPLPKRVMIEMNFMDKPAENDTVDHVLGWPERSLRKILWFTRTDSHPVNILPSIVHGNLSTATRGPVRRTDAFDSLLQQRTQFYAFPPGAALQTNIRLTKDIVQYLQSKGVIVVFYEMPTDRRLMLMERSVDMRRRVAQAFGRDRFCWLVLDHGENWHTADGVHLLAWDAAKVGKSFPAAPCMKPYFAAAA